MKIFFSWIKLLERCCVRRGFVSQFLSCLDQKDACVNCVHLFFFFLYIRLVSLVQLCGNLLACVLHAGGRSTWRRIPETLKSWRDCRESWATSWRRTISWTTTTWSIPAGTYFPFLFSSSRPQGRLSLPNGIAKEPKGEGIGINWCRSSDFLSFIMVMKVMNDTLCFVGVLIERWRFSFWLFVHRPVLVPFILANHDFHRFYSTCAREDQKTILKVKLAVKYSTRVRRVSSLQCSALRAVCVHRELQSRV